MTRRALHLLLLLLGALAAGCEAEGSGRGVLVITVDALRFDHIGAAGYDRATTPNLDRLASEGVFFEDAYASAPQVIPAHAALLTGCDPNLARRPRLPGSPPTSLLSAWFIPTEVPRLSRSFFAAGYSTAAFADHPWISPLYGFEQGFQTFRRFQAAGETEQRDVGVENVSRQFLHWIGKRRRDADWFAYLTLGDLERVWRTDDPLFDRYFEPRPELDYVPPLGVDNRVYFAVPRNRWSGGARTLGESEAKYDGALRRLDQQLGELFSRLQSQGRWDKTTVVVVGTFGVSFGESGLVMNSGTYADVDVHVPMIVKPASDARGAFTKGHRARGVVSAIDLAPTLLELHDVELPSGLHGVSQLPLLTGAGKSAREAAFVSWAIAGGFAVFDDRYCFESQRPGSLGPSVFTSSWFGDDRHHGKELRLYLHDREHSDSLGHIGPTSRDRDQAKRLQEAGEDWFHWIERANLTLHPVPWSEDPVSKEQLDELFRRDWIPDPRGARE